MNNMETARITPAHAGKSGYARTVEITVRDHPRPCGEKCRHIVKKWSWQGSPPPMRGKGGGALNFMLETRITPAHAGKRSKRSLCQKEIRDHPRPCGEKKNYQHSNKRHIGSPPPMRGKATLTAQRCTAMRITPAHAGKRLRKRRNTGIFVFQISRFHLVSHTPDTSYGNRPALYVRRLHRTPANLQASKAYDRARWAAYAWLFAVCPHTGS